MRNLHWRHLTSASKCWCFFTWSCSIYFGPAPAKIFDPVFAGQNHSVQIALLPAHGKAPWGKTTFTPPGMTKPKSVGIPVLRDGKYFETLMRPHPVQPAEDPKAYIRGQCTSVKGSEHPWMSIRWWNCHAPKHKINDPCFWRLLAQWHFATHISACLWMANCAHKQLAWFTTKRLPKSAWWFTIPFLSTCWF